MGNQMCCDDTKGTDLQQRPVVEMTHQHPNSSHIQKPSSIVYNTAKIPEVSDSIRDHLDANRPFQDRLMASPTIRAFGGDVFEGGLDQNGRPHGYGRMYKGDGALFVGNFDQGRANGPGRYIFRDGSYYDGEMRDNIAQTSKGYFYSDLLEYRGGFRNNTFHGHGNEKGLKHEFEGTYNEGKRIQGVFKWDTVPNNATYEYIYEGRFDNAEKFTGKGKLTEIRGQYEGEFLNGQKHGKGTYKFNNKIKYIGDYVKGHKEGEGTIYNEDNTVSYSGGWKNGLPNGKGFVLDDQGNQVMSNWRDGVDSRLLEN